jgi:3-oxoacyl-[acyl-carrier protein] reductase
MKRLENRVAIVTGGTAGIGEATALRFAREGAQVVVWARNEARGKEMEKKAAAEGLAITFDKVDTSDFEAVTAAAKRVADKFGKIDILINNAGITNDSTLKKMTVEQWQNVIDVNLSGTFYCCNCSNYTISFNLFFYLILTSKTCCINKYIFFLIIYNRCINRISSCSCYI